LSIAENVMSIQSRIENAAKFAGRNPKDICLVAATKMNSAEKVREAIEAGIAVCGENRVQELLEKNALNAYDGASLHFIGHLQKNKVRQVVGACSLIQSVDTLELMELIDLRAKALGIRQDILLEVNIGGEAAKSGFSEIELPQVLEKAGAFCSVFVRGIMAIPPISGEKGDNRPYFARMFKLYVDNSAKKYDNISMDFISMGMSDDFEDAIAEGSNMVRVGSAIFGARTYPQVSL
jgi:PLP dependent protein